MGAKLITDVAHALSTGVRAHLRRLWRRHGWDFAGDQHELAEARRALADTQRALAGAESRAHLLQTLVRANDVPLEDAPTVALSSLCDAGRWPVAELLEVGAPAHRHIAVCDPDRYAAFRVALEKLGAARVRSLLDGTRSAGGAIWLSPEACLIPAAEACACNIQGAHAVPIMVQGELAALLVMYLAAGATLDSSWMLTFEQVAAELGRILQLKAAREQAKRLALVASELDHAITIMDAKARIEWSNPGFSRLSGYSAEEVIGLSPESLLRGADTSSETVARVTEAVSKGQKISVELASYDKQGRKYWEELHVRPVLASDGSLHKIIAISTNITARKEAELELTRTQAFLHSIVQHVPVAIFVKGAAPANFGRFLLWNRTAEEIFGFSAEQAVGRSDYDFFPKEQADFFRAKDAETFATRTVQDILEEPVHSLRRGHRILHTVKVPVYTETGEPDFLLGVSEDVTDRKGAEAALIQAKNDAVAASRAKSAFLATMSHEIRTPLNGILGMLELLWHATAAGEHRHMLGMVRSSAEALLQIIGDILDFSKIEADKLFLDPVATDLEQLIDEAMKTVAPLAQQRGLKFVLDVSDRIACRVEVDPLRLRQVIFNLAGNALKFTKNQPDNLGCVEVQVDLENADGDRAALKLKVRDNGIGMSPRTLSEVFEPFVQADASTTRSFGGTGLGLSIVRRLIDLAGGALDVQSTLGAGTQFTVSWPVRVIQSSERPQPLCDIRVWIVSADPRLLAIRTRYLESAGAITSRADSACGARLPNTAPDVVVFEQADVGRGDEIRRLAPDASFVVLASVGRDISPQMPADTVVVADNPLLRSDLITAVLVAAGRVSLEAAQRFSSPPLPEAVPRDIDQAERDGRLLLVVEDNEINQAVIRGQLAVLGYASEVVSNGIEALARIERRRYALVLTDCDMPELDGFQLTARIRAAEADGARRLPIIAITANALSGEAERCRAAGMDGYLAKPIPLATLRDLLLRWIDDGRVKPESPALDPAALSVLMGLHDPILQTDLLARYALQARRINDTIAAAIARQDAFEAKEQAHKLKSSSAAVGANALSAICLSIEQAGSTQDFPELARLVHELERQLLRTLGEIDKLATSGRVAAMV